MLNATLPHLTPTVRAMVELQRLTGMPPGEVCRVRGCDIDTGGCVWFYRPHRRKTLWRGKARVVAIGPQAQQVLKPWLLHDTQAYLFSPARAMEEFRAGLRPKRRSKVQPPQVNRKRSVPKKQPGDRYARTAYTHAVARACDRAFPPTGELARKQLPVRSG